MIILLLSALLEEAARDMEGMARIKKVLESLVMLSEVWFLVQALSFLEPRQFYQQELAILVGKAQSNPKVTLVALQK
jgi:hypothetical protein